MFYDELGTLEVEVNGISLKLAQNLVDDGGSVKIKNPVKARGELGIVLNSYPRLWTTAEETYVTAIVALFSDFSGSLGQYVSFGLCMFDNCISRTDCLEPGAI